MKSPKTFVYENIHVSQLPPHLWRGLPADSIVRLTLELEGPPETTEQPAIGTVVELTPTPGSQNDNR
jgi:hypothetical protein